MWDARYSEHADAFGSEPNDFLRSQADRIPHGRVLCLGEGQGRNAIFLASLGFEVTALDASHVGMQQAAARAAQRGVSLTTIVADLADYRIEPGVWDGIVSIFVHLPPGLRQQVHAQAAAGIKSGGVFLLEAYTPAQLQFRTGGPSSPQLLMSASDVKAELTGLTFEIAHEIERDVLEGQFHSGRAAVVQVLARKP